MPLVSARHWALSVHSAASEPPLLPYSARASAGRSTRRTEGDSMPRVSAFYGIVIAMYYQDHAPPHFHARYGDHEALIDIQALRILQGWLPRRALALVFEWANLRQSELLSDWSAAASGVPLAPIAPLD